MTCPYCGNEMQNGIMSGDGRSRVFWKEGDQKATLADRIAGVGAVTAVRYTLATFTVETYFCRTCKKMIIDTDVGR